MNVQQLHVILNNHLQELNSNVFADPTDEVKDMFLYEAMLEFLRDNSDEDSNRLREGFQDTRKRYDNVKELIKESSLTFYKRDDRSLFAILPKDYHNGIKLQVEVYNNCEATTLTTQGAGVYSIQIPIKVDTGSPPYSGFTITDTTNADTLFDASDYYTSGLNTAEERFLLLKLMMEEISSENGLKFYWEWYQGNFASETLWVVSDTSVDIDVTYTEVALNTTYTLVAHSPVYTEYDMSSITATKKYPARLIKSEWVDDKLDTKFSTTFFNSPITEMYQDMLIIYHDNSFMIKSGTLKYIKIPNAPYLSLNRNIELRGRVVDLIVKSAAQRIAASRGNFTYPNIIQENMLNE